MLLGAFACRTRCLPPFYHKDYSLMSIVQGRYVQLSTTHVSRENRDFYLPQRRVYPCVVVFLEGRFVAIPQGLDDPMLCWIQHLPASTHLLTEVDSKGCSLIQFDRDAPELPGLPAFQW